MKFRNLFFLVISSYFGYYAYIDKNAIFGLTIMILSLLAFDMLDFARIFPGKKDRKRSFGVFFLFFVFFRTFFYDVMYVPSGSMTPTLLTGEFILVDKSAYGFNKESAWPFGKLLGILPSAQWSAPDRGDVVVWTRSTDKPLIFYVKRAVAIGGDTYQMIDGNLYINGKPSSMAKLDNGSILHDSGSIVPAFVYREISPDRKTDRLTVRDTELGEAVMDNTPLYQVPKDHFAIIGDNRMNGGSWDSRYMQDFPPMPYDQIIGKAKLVVFSHDAWKDFTKDPSWTRWFMELPYRFIKSLLHMRWDRMFVVVK